MSRSNTPVNLFSTNSGKQFLQSDVVQSHQFLFDKYAIPVLLLDNQGKIIQCNKAFCDLVQFDKTDIINNFGWNVFVPDPEEKEKIELFEKQRISGEGNPPSIYVFSAKSKDGTVKKFMIYVENLHECNLRQVMIFDHTAQLNSYHGTQNAENNLRKLLFSNPDLVFLLDQKGVFLEVNTKSEDKLFLSRSMLIGRNLNESKLPESVLKLTQKHLKLLFKTGNTQQFYYSLCINGSDLYFECRMMLAEENNVLAIIRDISESKQQEEHLVESERKLRLLVQDLPFAVLETNKNGVIEYVNKEGLRVLNGGLKPKKSRIFDKSIGLLTKHQFNAVLKANVKTPCFLVERKLNETVQFFEIHWAKDLSATVESSLVFVVYDISDKENDRIKLAASENNFRTLVQTSPNGIMIRDFDKVYFANDTARKILGVRKNEEIALDKILDSNALKMVHKRLQRVLNGEDMPFVEMSIKKQNSVEAVIIETKPVLIDYLGKKLFQIVFRDVSHEKQIARQRMLAEIAEKHNKNLQDEIDQRIIVEDELRHMLAENKALIQEIHHRVKNNFQIVTSIINQSINKIEDQKSSVQLREAKNRIQSMSIVHECYYQQKDYSAVDLVAYFEKILASIRRDNYQLLGEQCLNFITNLKLERVSMDEAIPSGLIFNELITICSKFLYDSSNKYCIFVTLKKKSSSIFIIDLSIFCDGNKINQNITTSKNDLELLETVVLQLNGRVRIVNKNELLSVEFCIHN